MGAGINPGLGPENRLHSSVQGQQPALSLLIIMLTTLILMGCERLIDGAARSPATTEKSMAMTTPSIEVSHPLPPLDRQIPAVVETATFALG